MNHVKRNTDTWNISGTVSVPNIERLEIDKKNLSNGNVTLYFFIYLFIYFISMFGKNLGRSCCIYIRVDLHLGIDLQAADSLNGSPFLKAPRLSCGYGRLWHLQHRLLQTLGLLGHKVSSNFWWKIKKKLLETVGFAGRWAENNRTHVSWLVAGRASNSFNETNLKMILTPKPGVPQFNITHGTIRVAHAGGISGIMGPGTGRDFTSSLAINGSKTSGIRRPSSPHGCQNGAIRLTLNLHKN